MTPIEIIAALAGLAALAVLVSWPSRRPRRGPDEYDLSDLDAWMRARVHRVPLPEVREVPIPQDGGER